MVSVLASFSLSLRSLSLSLTRRFVLYDSDLLLVVPRRLQWWSGAIRARGTAAHCPKATQANAQQLSSVHTHAEEARRNSKSFGRGSRERQGMYFHHERPPGVGPLRQVRAANRCGCDGGGNRKTKYKSHRPRRRSRKSCSLR